MAEKTLIAWCDHTANFWMGCIKVSPGCKFCYAETLTTNRMGLHVWGPGSERQPVKSVWANLRKWDRAAEQAGERRRAFMSLADFFEDHPGANALRPQAWEAIRSLRWLDMLLLTKRPENIAAMLPSDWGEHGYPNVWLGTSIENDEYVHRADLLRSIPAVVRFISYEPAIGPVPSLDLTAIDWLIYGGESGPNFRPEDKQWARDVRTKCDQSGTAFLHKQSAATFTERGVELDGEIVRNYPTPRRIPLLTLSQPGLF